MSARAEGSCLFTHWRHCFNCRTLFITRLLQCITVLITWYFISHLYKNTASCLCLLLSPLSAVGATSLRRTKNNFTRGKKTLFTKMLTVNNEEKEVIDFDPRLQGPFTCLVAGPTGCGKTQLIFKLIENTAQLITPTVHYIVYCYGQWQKDFKKYDNKVNFHEGLIPREQIFPVNSQESSTQHTLLIIDDLLGKEDTSLVRDIFIKGSHHNNISVIFVTQNLFLPHKDYRTLSLNAHYLVIFKNPRDMSQINALARQAFASKPTFLTAVYNRETSDRHSYLLLDFKQSTPELMRVRDSITTPWKTTVFVPTYK